MLGVLGSLFVAALSVSPVARWEGGQTTADGTAIGPRMEISPESHDVGTVGQNEMVDREFEIRNTGTEDLEIGRIATSCGLTAGLVSEDRVIGPGETAVLRVTLETRRYKGLLRRNVSVASNDPRRVGTVGVRAYVTESGGTLVKRPPEGER
jgi:hypothetical protein